jgi:hypothetical protein
MYNMCQALYVFYEQKTDISIAWVTIVCMQWTELTFFACLVSFVSFKAFSALYYINSSVNMSFSSSGTATILITKFNNQFTNFIKKIVFYF